MRAHILALISIIGLAGCSSAADKAEHQYVLVKNNPGASASDICSAGRAVADAYLKAEDAQKYRERSNEVGIDCMGAKLDAQNGRRES